MTKDFLNCRQHIFFNTKATMTKVGEARFTLMSLVKKIAV